MKTLRRRIVESIADLLNGVDWTVTTRATVDTMTGGKVAKVYDASERKAIRDGAGFQGGQYLCELAIEVRVLVDPAEAAAAAVDPMEFLDDAVGELEALMSWATSPDPSQTLGVPGVQYADYTGNRPDTPDEDTGFLGAVLSVDVTYKHDLDNPRTIGGIS